MAPLKRARSLAADKREILFQEARQEFARGYEQASFNRIIKRSGISKGSVYYHFADKADLFSEVVLDAFAEIRQHIGPLKEPRDAAQYWFYIESLVTGFDAVAVQNPQMGTLGRALYLGWETNNALVRLRSHAEDYVSGLLAKGQTVAAVRDDLPLSLLTGVITSMVIGMDRWFLEHWEEVGPEQLAILSHKTLSLCRTVLSPTEVTGA